MYLSTFYTTQTTDFLGILATAQQPIMFDCSAVARITISSVCVTMKSANSEQNSKNFTMQSKSNSPHPFTPTNTRTHARTHALSLLKLRMEIYIHRKF